MSDGRREIEYFGKMAAKSMTAGQRLATLAQRDSEFGKDFMEYFEEKDDRIAELEAKLTQARTVIDRLVAALEAVKEVNDDPCYHDHHGLCQAHHLRRVESESGEWVPQCEMALVDTALESARQWQKGQAALAKEGKGE